MHETACLNCGTGLLGAHCPLVARRPGELTRGYVEGERARFVSPMAPFLFSVFMMFAVFQAVGLSAPSDVAQGIEAPADFTAARAALGEQQAEVEQATVGLPQDDLRRAAMK